MVSSASVEQKSASDPSNEKQVTLGPACLVVFVIGALFVSVAMIIASFMIMGNQGPMAARALEMQLIPWVEQSTLEPTDREVIIRQLKDLVADLKSDRLDERQMVRLKMWIADSPILQWGVIQQIESRIRTSGLTEQEKEAAELELDRLLRSGAEGKLPNEQLEFVVQNVATKERKSGRLTAKETSSDTELREFLRRAKAFSDGCKIPEEPFPKSPSQVFRGLVEEALSAK